MDDTILPALAYTFRFPLELERIIFEHAAFRDHKTALQLIRVSRRVCQWLVPDEHGSTSVSQICFWCYRVEPLIYEFIPINCTAKFLRSVADSAIAKPIEFYAAHVKAICIKSGALQEQTISKRIQFRIFTTFTSLENIALWHHWPRGDDTICEDASQKANIGKSLRPKMFSSNIERFFAISDIPNRQPDFTAPFFSRLTHLDIMDSMVKWTSWTSLTSLPCLTHLQFLDVFEYLFDHPTSHAGVKPLIAGMLKECRTLEVVLFCSQNRVPYTRKKVEALMGPCNDPRCVVLPFQDDIEYWDSPCLGTADMWSLAEETARAQAIISLE